MHPQDFKNLLDHAYEEFYAITEDLHRAKKENKALLEELSKVKSINNSLSAKICNMSSFKILKMGSGWFIDGESFLNLSLVKRLKFTAPICNVKISPLGKIAFTSNKKIFILIDNEIFLVNDGIKLFDPKCMKFDLIENQKEIFDFIGEDLIVYQNEMVKRYLAMQEHWMIGMRDVICIRSENNVVYIGTNDCQVHVYTDDGNYQETMHFDLPFNSFTVKNGHIITIFDNTITVDSKTSKSESGLIVSYDMDDQSVFYISDPNTIKIASNTNLDLIDTINFKRSILCIAKYRSFLLVATQERVVNVFDFESKKTMRIVMQDVIVDMCCNENFLCFVDNNGGLSVWEVFE